jgi:P pilus assembly chaperone PapD
MKSLLAPIAFAITMLGLFADPGHALSVSPIHLEMTTVGAGSRAQIVVTNESREPVPVELSFERMIVNEDGSTRSAKARDELLVFPPQAMIPAGSSQTFRIQWVGEPDQRRSETFLVAVNQIPVKAATAKHAVQLVMSIGVMVNIAPPQGTPALRLVGTGIVVDKKGRRSPTVTVENPSNTHAILRDADIRLTSGGWSAALSSQDIAQKVGVGLVQPGTRRRFVLPVVLPANVKALKGEIDYRPRRK